MGIVALGFLASALGFARGAIVSTDLTLQNAVLSPDGFTRDVVTAGGTIPGQFISGNVGDEFQINVIDNLSNTTMDVVTSIHWHGLFQHTTNDMDGTSWVTQCPLIPSNSFLYDFTPTGQSGTYWYHSHYSTQYCDGLSGPFIIYDPADPNIGLYDVDNSSTVVFLSDYYHTPAKELTGTFPLPDATLFNGLGRNAVTPNSTLQVFSVLAGTRYRYRLINGACHPNFNFSIDGHTLTVIEVEGVPVQPYEVELINILVAQRYSFVLTANQPVDNYWIRAVSNLNPLGTTDGVNSAILRYFGASITDPITSAQANPIILNEQLITPVTVTPAPGLPEVDGAQLNINLDVAFPGPNFTVNGYPWINPQVPVLLQILSGATAPGSIMPNGSIYSLPLNQSIQISIPGGSAGGPHPIHLHGHNFAVVRSAGNATYNWHNPPVRDTVNMGSLETDNVTIRFETNNPGPWFLHCHIDWHLAVGFAVVMAEDAPDVSSVDTESPAWDQLCTDYNSYIGA